MASFIILKNVGEKVVCSWDESSCKHYLAKQQQQRQQQQDRRHIHRLYTSTSKNLTTQLPSIADIAGQ